MAVLYLAFGGLFLFYVIPGVYSYLDAKVNGFDSSEGRLKVLPPRGYLLLKIEDRLKWHQEQAAEIEELILKLSKRRKFFPGATTPPRGESPASGPQNSSDGIPSDQFNWTHDGKLTTEQKWRSAKVKEPLRVED